jgi:hypothetical protein
MYPALACPRMQIDPIATVTYNTKEPLTELPGPRVPHCQIYIVHVHLPEVFNSGSGPQLMITSRYDLIC